MKQCTALPRYDVAEVGQRVVNAWMAENSGPTTARMRIKWLADPRRLQWLQDKTR